MRDLKRVATMIGLACTLAAPAGATVTAGQTAPPFTKTRLGGGTTSLSDHAGKVVVLFLFGYGCPYCINDAPSVESDLRAWYEARNPGQVQVLGVDLWNGTSSQVQSFADETGVTFPLLLAGSAASGGNLATLYGPYDNYVVINRQGIVRYHAADLWPHGNRYHLNEVRAAIDSLVAPTVSVPPRATAPGLRLAASPNPFRGVLRVELALPRAAARARIALHDVTGRRVAVLHEGPLPAGAPAFEWPAGARGLRPGVYELAAEIDGRRLARRVVRLP